MRKYLPAVSVIIIFLLTFLGVSCTPEACFEETNAFVKASFYSEEKQVTPDSITLYGLGHETTKIYDRARNVKPALFPINAASDNSVFIIRINGVTDTITFRYSSYPHLISRECGYTFYHIIETPVFTRHIIENIIVNNRNITTVNEENIRIFY